MNHFFYIINCLILTASASVAQEIIPLYKETIPGSISTPLYKEKTMVGNDGRNYINHVITPTLTVYLPQAGKANRASVIICPGGGYRLLAIDHEGIELAKRFNDYGITAFVLKYRLPSDSIMTNKTIGPLQDAQRAIQLVRSSAKLWNLDAGKIGIVGSSAGGHLAATAGTLFNEAVIPNADSISLRPSFMILLYPVISFGALAHTSSAKTLLGEDLSATKTNRYSSELQVTSQTPPAFLVHAGDDQVVSVNHSILFYQALLAKNIRAEMHLYEKGGHGFGLHNKTTTGDWFISLVDWLRSEQIIPVK